MSYLGLSRPDAPTRLTYLDLPASWTGAEDEAEQVRRSDEGGIRGHPKARVCSPRLSEPASAGLWLELLVIVPAGRVPNYSPRRGDFEVQQVQQNHKRPCLQEVSEFLKVQQKCNMKCNMKCNKVQQGAVQHGVQQRQRKSSVFSGNIQACACLRGAAAVTAPPAINKYLKKG